jgi:hypothetical protein
MPLYSAIDLHGNNNVTLVLDEQDQVVYQKRLTNHLPLILEAWAPFQAQLQGIVRLSKNAVFGPNSLPGFWTRPSCPGMPILAGFWTPMRRPKKWARPKGQFGRPNTDSTSSSTSIPSFLTAV